ncbi:hypothetical protein WR25_07889 [Diploscapter pachys]|uniref:Aminotransferase class I/classII large domain-containing protein n=1 Tax=Diploscapter pachys TaxID=2018661 RepID=A0A2A2LQQ8_9BILA|nr:hypothetical protein WR25_07889 [Diploscapter pachys]
MKPDRSSTKAAKLQSQQRISREEIDERLIMHEIDVFAKTHPNMVTIVEDSEWPVLPQSKHSLNTVNPIRKIADAMAVQPNPEKSLLKLHLGDPSISGKFPPPRVAVEAMKEAVESHMWDGYGPAVGAVAAREAVAQRYTHPEAPVTADDVVLASGCSHALQMAIEAVAGPGDNILVPHPGFPLYSTLCRPHGIEVR